MVNLYFGDLFSILTTVLVLGMLSFIFLSIKNRNRIKKWGRLIVPFILFGTAVSAFSATRDGYATTSAVFAMDGMQSMICSIVGGAIFLTAFISIFFRNQVNKRNFFFILSALFVIKVLVIELSRIFMLL